MQPAKTRKAPLLRLFIAGVFAFSSAGVHAQNDEGFEELFFGDLPKVSLASKSEQTTADAPSIVSVVTAQEIKDMGARTWEDILRILPGFDVTLNPQFLTPQVNVRGVVGRASSNKVKFMLNGNHILQFQTGGPGFIFSWLPVENIARIEVIRGPGSALYGANAFTGVVNVITKGPEQMHRFTARGTTFSDSRLTGAVAHKTSGDVGFSLYADYSREVGQRKRVNSDAADAQFADLHAAMAGFGYTGDLSGTPTRNRWNADAIMVEPRLTIGDTYVNTFFIGARSSMPFGAARAITDENDNRETLLMSEVGHDWKFSDKNSLNVRGYYNYGTLDSHWELFSEETADLFDFFNDLSDNAAIDGSVVPHPEGEGITGNPRERYASYGGETAVTLEPFSGAQLVAGLLYNVDELLDVGETANSQIFDGFGAVVVNGVVRRPFEWLGGEFEVEPGLRYIPQDSIVRVNTAAYGQTTLDLKELFSAEGIGQRLALTVGVRNDRYNDVGSSLNPRAGLVYAPTEALHFKALYGTAFRAPGVDELYFQYNPVLNGNRNVKPEKLVTSEFLVGWKAASWLRNTVTFAETHIRDLIEPGTAGLRAENAGKLEARSVEWESRMPFSKASYGYLNATYQDVKNVAHAPIAGTSQFQPDYNPGSVPHFLANVGLNHDFAGKLNANVSVNHAGKRPRSGALELDGADIVQADSRPDVKARTIVNLTTRLHSLSGLPGVEVTLQLRNAFNAGWRDPEENGLIRDDLPRQGRDVAMQVSYSF